MILIRDWQRTILHATTLLVKLYLDIRTLVATLYTCLIANSSSGSSLTIEAIDIYHFRTFNS